MDNVDFLKLCEEVAESMNMNAVLGEAKNLKNNEKE